MPKIKWTEKAVLDLKGLDRIVAKRVVVKISWFGDNFEYLSPEMLSNEFNNLYKIRVGETAICVHITQSSVF